ncbi:MAG: proline--tRNA ligase [Tenericutes bacterium]|jgi:prolyl-tRNA synthetase|nr:proline--tRNA ligase [Mycoplasmatota bacterium]
MRLSQNYFYTLREIPKDEDSISGRLLVRSGMIKKSSSGIYMFLPLGYKVLKNIERIIREEMNKSGASELLMPVLIPEDIYISSGRRDIIGQSMFALKDRYNRDYILGPTHEELFAIAAGMKIKSYKDIPFNIYQFETKFRDEVRPRYGLIRVREFIMKDAYSFDKDLKGLDISYNKMFTAYKNIFDRMKLNYKIVTADTGIMGGLLSEEFQAISEIGEDILALCSKCDYATNIEVAECVSTDTYDNEEIRKYTLVETKGAKTIEEISSFFNLTPDKFVKTLICKADNKYFALLVKGDDEINFIKIGKLLKVKDIQLATSDEVIRITGAEVGYAGPLNLNIDIIIDNEVLRMKNFIVGANKSDYHYKDVNLNDFKYINGDIRNIKETDVCPKCLNKISFKKGIEIGNTFKLGTKYSDKLDLKYMDEHNKEQLVVMGSYGIGLGRCMGALVEQNHDEKGIIWPYEVAPYKVCIVIANINDEIQLELANQLYKRLLLKNIEVLVDDRDERIGVKLNDMDLIGIPIRILIGRKASEGKLEFKLRTEDTVSEENIEEAITKIVQLDKC